MKKTAIVLLFFILFSLFGRVNAQSVGSKISPSEKVLQVRVEKVLSQRSKLIDGGKYVIQSLTAIVEKGEIKGRKIKLQTTYIPNTQSLRYKAGDKLLVGFIDEVGEDDYFYIIGPSRTTPMLLLLLIFLGLTFIVTKKQGLRSILGLIFSYIVIFKFIIPLIASGQNPILISIAGLLIVLPVSFYLSHGVNKKTTSALLSTLISLLVTLVIAKFFVDWASLTGAAADEIQTLIFSKGEGLNLKGLLTAGIVIGALGVLDDITISQTSIVQELKTTKLTIAEVYKKAMIVGKDHLTSIINTLILVYTGAALPTLILFTEYPRPLVVTLNSEIIATEVVIALTTTIGLILAIPISTLLACVMVKSLKTSS